MNIDQLLNCKVALGLQTEIPDMSDYALQWLVLAGEFDAVGMLSNAQYCRDRGEHYAELADGNYSRVLEGSFATLELLPAPSVAE